MRRRPSSSPRLSGRIRDSLVADALWANLRVKLLNVTPTPPDLSQPTPSQIHQGPSHASASLRLPLREGPVHFEHSRALRGPGYPGASPWNRGSIAALGRPGQAPYGCRLQNVGGTRL